MKKINKMIRKTILEIALVISFVFLSIPLWQKFNLEEYETVAVYYDNINYTHLEVSDINDYVLYQTSDEIALENVKPININLINDTNTLENYSVWLVIDKQSTLDYQEIKINYNNETSFLSNHKTLEDREYKYILLSEGKIKAENVNSQLLMWIDSNAKSDITNKTLIFDIENNPGQVL